MANCDYCGAFYRGGAIRDGDYRFCTGPCHQRGQSLTAILADVPEAEVSARIADVHTGPCPRCAKRRNVDIYDSFRTWSALVYTKWETRSHLCCRICARKHQISDLIFCLYAGWWSSPFGLLIGPFQIFRNIREMLHRSSIAGPSKRLQQRVRMD